MHRKKLSRASNTQWGFGRHSLRRWVPCTPANGIRPHSAASCLGCDTDISCLFPSFDSCPTETSWLAKILSRLECLRPLPSQLFQSFGAPAFYLSSWLPLRESWPQLGREGLRTGHPWRMERAPGDAHSPILKS